jgi:hypothetical protein
VETCLSAQTLLLESNFGFVTREAQPLHSVPRRLYNLMHNHRKWNFAECIYKNFLSKECYSMKNAVIWDMTPSGSCKNRRFGGTDRLHHQGERNQGAKKKVTSISLQYASVDRYC